MRSTRFFMAISSIHFKRCDYHFQTEHNSRNTDNEPTYLLDKQYRKSNEWLELNNAVDLHEQQKIIRKQKHSRGKMPELKDSTWDAVVNLNSNHTIEDLKKVAEHIQKQYHLTPCSLAVHRDEGYRTEDGRTHYNLHGHIVFYTVDNGISQMRKINRTVLRNIQTEVADILQMERGQENSKKTRLEHKQYREMKRALENQEKEFLAATDKLIEDGELIPKETVKKMIEEQRKKWIAEQNHVKEDYKELRKLADKQYRTIEELNKKIEELDSTIKQVNKKYNALVSTSKEQIKQAIAPYINGTDAEKKLHIVCGHLMIDTNGTVKDFTVKFRNWGNEVFIDNNSTLINKINENLADLDDQLKKRKQSSKDVGRTRF